MGDRNHPREKVKANVVRANIPVANGVVHLIDKPLIIVASPLWDYLQEEVSKQVAKATFPTLNDHQCYCICRKKRTAD